MENKFLNQARQAMQNLSGRDRQPNGQAQADEQEVKAIQQCIQSAYQSCSPEEEQELQQLENELNEYK
ncbi:DUF3813 family protein [Alkalibacillus haloalkaliphilus]|uniref:DUF3813 family protein n=1 Tax=Alkalibacillus haloalkaliphilus TaxID=94136 RepID=UPI0003133809|nr:DUF3813 family protein [Alkalibacillus haloalkaliphilus]